MDIDPIVLPAFVVGAIIFSGVVLKKKIDAFRRKRSRIQKQA